MTGENRPKGCVFCLLLAEDEDEKNLILYRGEHNIVIMNLFPYSNGHLMVLPYEHVADITMLDLEKTSELMELTKRCQSVLREIYNPNGFNLGMNQGKCAGAGVEEHLHMHILPRWIGDSNFLSIIGETRVMPEDLKGTYTKLAPFFK